MVFKGFAKLSEFCKPFLQHLNTKSVLHLKKSSPHESKSNLIEFLSCSVGILFTPQSTHYSKVINQKTLITHHSTLNIALTGPESSGKSTLGISLAEELGGVYIPEYAREYFEKKGNSDYTAEDIVNIAIGQNRLLEEYLEMGTQRCTEKTQRYTETGKERFLEEVREVALGLRQEYTDTDISPNIQHPASNTHNSKLITHNSKKVYETLKVSQTVHAKALSTHNSTLYFIDTEALVCKIWMEWKYGYCDPIIEKLFAEQPIDLYLLCAPDIPWQFDPLRECPTQDDREALFQLYFDALTRYGKRFEVVRR